MQKRREETEGYVLAPLKNSEGEISLELAGTIKLGKSHGEFRYADHWLSAVHAYPLDPANLKLSDQRYKTTNRLGVFGVFHDAGPDDWGTKVQLHNHNSKPRNELERLLRLSGSGVGALQFSLARSKARTPPALQDEAFLQDLAKATAAIASDQQLSDEQLRLLEPGSSMGGARPKTTVMGAQGARLIKFSRPQDVVNNPLIEYASMTLLAKSGIEIPACELLNLGVYGHAFAIERFDRIPNQPVHFISAHSLFNTDRQREYADGLADPCSYMALARLLRQHTAKPQADCQQLYRRMLANVMLGNSDDHGRNHAMIFDINSGQWALSPAYDMLPMVSATSATDQALSIGRSGRESSLENALSCAESFCCSKPAALEILNSLYQSLANWRQHFQNAAVSAKDIVLLDRVITPRLNEAADILEARPQP